MKKQSLNALAASYRADLLYYIERAKLGKCPPHWQAYCFGEIAAAKGTDAYPEDGDTLLDELHRLVDTVPQITNREESAAEIAAYRGQMLFYFDRDYYTLAELVRLPFCSLKGLGGAAADALENATLHGQEYLSIEELQQASGVGSSIIDRLRQVGALGDLPESSQVSFF